jgi:hypothetical protein
MKTILPKDAIKFVQEVEKFSKSKLMRKAELIRIYEESINNDRAAAFEDLIFTAKYALGLMRIAKSGKINKEINNLDQINKDFTESINKIISKIKEIIISADHDLKMYFELTYFEMKKENFINMVELLSDLEWAKKYYNEIRRNPL